MASIDLPKYVRVIVNQHGTERLQFQRRRGAPRKIMTSEPGTPEFEREYGALIAGLDPATLVTLAVAGETKSAQHLDQFDDSVGALCAAYFASEDFRTQHLDSQVKVRRLINNCLAAEVPFNGKPRAFAGWPCDLVTPTDIQAMRAAVKPARACRNGDDRAFRDSHVQFFRAVWNWGLGAWTHKAGDKVVHLLRTSNPCARLKALAPETEGWHTMTTEEHAAYQAAFPVGTEAHLAMSVLRYTAVRRSDGAMIGAPMLRTVKGKRVLVWTEEKGKGKAPKARTMPVHPELWAAIQATPGALDRPTFIVGKRGGQLTRGSFGELFKEWCVEAGLAHCSCHSVRKFVATDLAEKNATVHAIRAVGGWTSLRQVQRYTKRVDNARLAEEALGLM